MITVGNISIQSRFAINSINDLQIRVSEGSHGSLVLRGYLSDDRLLGTITGDRIKVSCEGVKDGLSEILFCGSIQEAHVFVENGVKQVILWAATASVKMDLEEESHSFQNIKMTYGQLTRQIVVGCGGKVLCERSLEQIGIPMVQYKETNWQFLNRTASCMGLGVFCDETADAPVISLGLPRSGRKVWFNTSNYKCCADEKYYYSSAASKSEFLYYRVESDENYYIGDCCYYKGKTGYIYDKEIELINGLLVFRYKLGGICHFRRRREYNRKLAGTALSAKVVKTDREKVYIKLDIDGSSGKGVYPYPWSAVTGNLLYSMPQVGTKVFLYFPDSHEERAFVVCSMLSGNETTIPDNSQNRVFGTEHGKRLELYAEEMSLKGGMDTGQQLLSVQEGVLALIAGSGKIRFTAESNVALKAPMISLCTPLEIKQIKSSRYAFEKSTHMRKKGSRNPATGGDSSFSMQYEFSGLAKQGVLCGTMYEEYIPFDDAPDFEYDLPLGVKFLAGAALALAVGAVVGAIVFLAAPALVAVAGVAITAAQIGIAAGAITATAGILAAAVTAAQDDGTTSIGEYLGNALRASAEVGGAMIALVLAPYASEVLTSIMIPQGMTAVPIFGHWISAPIINGIMSAGTFGVTGANLFFQLSDVGMFAAGKKGLGEATGNKYYDSIKQYAEIASWQIAFIGAMNPRLYENASNNIKVYQQLKSNGVRSERLVYGSNTKSAHKLHSQMSRRGWTEDLINDTVDHPFTIRRSFNKATGGPATVFYNADGSYVVVDDITNEIIQISDKTNLSNWSPDDSIIDPYKP